jgi:DNA invertase Pin-like site-specific DNA recombinase
VSQKTSTRVTIRIPLEELAAIQSRAEADSKPWRSWIREAAVSRAKRTARKPRVAPSAERRFAPEQIREMRRLRAARVPESSLAIKYGCSAALVHRICAGISYADVT